VIGAYPGTFNPPTVAHLAIAEAAWRQGGLDRLDLLVSHAPLGKSDPATAGPVLSDRLAVLRSLSDARPWLGVRSTDLTLIADLATGYDAVVMGADKWLQVVDPVWYGGSVAARDAALAALPRVLLADRAGHAGAAGLLPAGSLVLEVPVDHGLVSSTGVRSGRLDWMAPEAAAFDRETGAWSDPCRYRGQSGD
jgi:hypothetical protein